MRHMFMSKVCTRRSCTWHRRRSWSWALLRAKRVSSCRCWAPVAPCLASSLAVSLIIHASTALYFTTEPPSSLVSPPVSCQCSTATFCWWSTAEFSALSPVRCSVPDSRVVNASALILLHRSRVPFRRRDSCRQIFEWQRCGREADVTGVARCAALRWQHTISTAQDHRESRCGTRYKYFRTLSESNNKLHWAKTFMFSVATTKIVTQNQSISVADLEGGRAPPLGRRTDAVTHGHVS